MRSYLDVMFGARSQRFFPSTDWARRRQWGETCFAEDIRSTSAKCLVTVEEPMESSKPSLQNLSRLRRIGAALLSLSAALWASPGLAQTTTGLTQTDFTLRMQRQDGDTWVDLATTDAAIFLNQARCQCAAPVRIVVQMASASQSKLSSLTTTGTNARLYVGNSCVQLNTAVVPPRPQCDTGQLGRLDNLSALSADGSWVVETTVDKLFAAVGIDCGATLATTIWLWLDSTGGGYPDSGVTGGSAPHLGIALDGTAPEAPSGITVEGSDKALMVSWGQVSVSDGPDQAGYLVFCMTGDNQQVFNPSNYNNQYLTGQLLCGTPAAATASPMASAAGNTTAVELEAPAAFQNLDPSYLCSGLLPLSKTSMRLSALQNGIPYTVGVAVVDNSGNASPIRSGFVQVPVQGPTAAGGSTGGLGRSGCSCHLAGGDRGAIPWGAMLALGLASRLWRRGKRQRKVKVYLASSRTGRYDSWPGATPAPRDLLRG